QRAGKGAPVAEAAPGPNAPTVQLDKMLGNRQTKPRARRRVRLEAEGLVAVIRSQRSSANISAPRRAWLGVTRARPIHLEQAVEDTPEVLFADPNAGVGDLHHHLGTPIRVTARLGTYRHAALLWRVLDRVVNEIDQHLANAVGINLHIGQPVRR